MECGDLSLPRWFRRIIRQTAPRGAARETLGSPFWFTFALTRATATSRLQKAGTSHRTAMNSVKAVVALGLLCFFLKSVFFVPFRAWPGVKTFSWRGQRPQPFSFAACKYDPEDFGLGHGADPSRLAVLSRVGITRFAHPTKIKKQIMKLSSAKLDTMFREVRRANKVARRRAARAARRLLRKKNLKS